MMNLDSKIIEQSRKIGALLSDKKMTITTVESCTGGGISYALTEIPGSSAYVERCFVTYCNNAKNELVGVSQMALDTYGAVSKDVVSQMAQGGQFKAKADFAIAVSGIAGPGGGSEHKPVGTVWFGFATPHTVVTQCLVFDGDRGEVRKNAIYHALTEILKLIDEQN